MNKKIAIVGSGQVAEALVAAFCSEKTTKNITIIARNQKKSLSLANKYRIKYSDDFVTGGEFDYIIIAVKDDCIGEVSEIVSRFSLGAVVCHTSGSVNIDVISHKNRDIGVFYPLQSFTAGVKLDFATIPIFIEANSDENVLKLRELGELISPKVSVVSSKSREKLHLCAVFANNFTNHIFTLTNELIEDEGVDPKSLIPLIKATFERVVNEEPKKIQTGPARRGDLKTISRHLEILGDNKSARDIYETLSNSILNRYKDEF